MRRSTKTPRRLDPEIKAKLRLAFHCKERSQNFSYKRIRICALENDDYNDDDISDVDDDCFISKLKPNSDSQKMVKQNHQIIEDHDALLVEREIILNLGVLEDSKHHSNFVKKTKSKPKEGKKITNLTVGQISKSGEKKVVVSSPKYQNNPICNPVLQSKKLDPTKKEISCVTNPSTIPQYSTTSSSPPTTSFFNKLSSLSKTGHLNHVPIRISGSYQKSNFTSLSPKTDVNRVLKKKGLRVPSQSLAKTTNDLKQTLPVARSKAQDEKTCKKIGQVKGAFFFGCKTVIVERRNIS
ncbi:uncharacterized protein SAPINGB_P001142 [Magnusiomyces paraingens]|uniref:Uncharacterized protein n=1 Tax=Magnusiomyces paraingens TaxID=2606893 RepID=A0A5E8B4S7_9ASCO|nr:uncharacterized protein SAPINGB_P001142 [Saprochaete ingens]VVT46294.1 unnamed protein product [Saprochaete ingens]